MPFTLTITFRGDGAWGTGIHVDLSEAQIDGNFWEIKQAIENLVNNPIDPILPTGIDYSSGGLNFTLSNADVIGPVPIPILTFNYRDEFIPFATYAVLDVFSRTGNGLYLVQKAFTAGAALDPALLSDGTPPTLKKIFALDVPPEFTVGDLSNVVLTALAEGDLLRFDGTNFVNVPRPYVIATNFNGVMADTQHLLHHKLAHDVAWEIDFGDVDAHSSQAAGTAHAAASTVVDVLLCPAASDPSNTSNYTKIGDITFASGTVTPTFATVGHAAKSGAKGDVVWVRGPASHDTTFAGFMLTLVGREAYP